MKNTILCKNCNYENPFYALICANCKAFIRSKIPNIDLWYTLIKVIESPILAFRNIIHADHKNFVVPIIILATLKISINSFVINSILKSTSENNYGYMDYLIVSALIMLIIFLISFFEF